jgi:F-type H+-transporting ATPase subunit a
MTFRRGFTSFFLLLGLLATPAFASEDSAKTPVSSESSLKATAPHKTEEEEENDIWKDNAVTGAKTDTIDAGKLFGKIISHLDDAYELHFFSAHIPLPIIFTDSHGFHFFAGMERLQESGVYRLKDPDKYEEQKKKSQFLWTSPWERVDGADMGFTLDLSMTAKRFFMLLASLFVVLLVWSAGRKSKKALVPKGAHNLVETIVVYVRDEIVYPNIEKKWADKFMSYFLTIFFFIFAINVFGLVPMTKTATGAVGVTLALALCTFVLTQFAGIRTMGLSAYLKHFTGGLHEMDIPLVMKIILICIMVPIEFVGLFTKPFALTVRLFANMTAGHIVIGALIGLALLFQSIVAGFAVSVPFAIFIYLLEILVAALQAFIFTILSALFVGMMVHEHHEGEHETKEEILAEVSI